MVSYGDGTARAVRAYRSTSDNGMTGADAAVALHERLCRELAAAKAAYDARTLDQMCRHTALCTQVLLELRAGLKTKIDSDPGIQALDEFYTFLFVGVARVLRTKNPSVHLQGLIDMLWKFSQNMRAEREKLETHRAVKTIN